MFAKKIMTNAALVAVLGGVGMGVAVPTFAAPGAQAAAPVKAGEVPVSYEYVKGTPDDPANPTATVKVQPSITFDGTVKEANADVQLLNDKGTGAYTGTNRFDVKVKSTNGFKLQHETGAGVDDVAYQLTNGAGVALGANNTEQALGTLEKTAAKINSKAKLTGTATMDGNHTDQLVYTFEKK